MAYQSLYRKYRPQTFADVVGQGHVTRTLQNALAGGRVAHGYLFTGTRGTAKTTVARLLAKALNCQSSDSPTPEPCNVCDACIRITNGSCVDVVEMDAASHRGVADIEAVRTAVGFGPMEMRYKVFIIDEAHQLSSDAKDAFLKTLEEPPANVVFVLATTEPQAIPITIRSRCQQFDFKRGSLQEIASRLRYVLDAEGVTYAPDAVGLIARGAEGSYRDSLSLLEQVLAFSPSHIAASDVETVLGTLDAEALAQVMEAVARKDAPTALALAGQLLDSGKEARTLLRSLAAHFRDLLLVTVGGPAASMELTADEVTRLQQEQQVCRFAPGMLLRAMDVLNEAQGETRWNNQHRLLVELTFLKLMTLDEAPTAAAKAGGSSFAGAAFLTAPVTPAPAPMQAAPAAPKAAAPTAPPKAAAVTATPKQIEEPVSSDSHPPRTRAARGTPSLASERGGAGVASREAAPEPLRHSELPPLSLAREGGRGGESLDEGPADPDAEDDPYGPDDQTPSLFGEDAPTPAAPRAAEKNPSAPVSASPAAAGVPEETAEDEPSLDASYFTGDDGDGEAEDDDDYAPDPIPEPVVKAKPAPAVAAPDPEPEPDDAGNGDGGIQLELGQVMRAWPRFLAAAQKTSKQTEVMMSQARPVEASGKTVVVAFSARMNYERMSEPKKMEFVRELLRRSLDIPSVVVRFTLDEDVPPPPPRSRGEKRSLTRDPLAALDEAEAAPLPPPPPLDDDGWGGYAAPAPPPPAPKLPVGDAAAAPRHAPPSTEEAAAPAVSAPAPAAAPPPAPSPAQRAAAALDNPLVQETLQVFGGEIVEE